MSKFDDALRIVGLIIVDKKGGAPYTGGAEIFSGVANPTSYKPCLLTQAGLNLDNCLLGDKPPFSLLHSLSRDDPYGTCCTALL